MSVLQPVSINGLEFDALISEDEALKATVPEYSVEDGSTISDSIILGPETLNMTLFVTDTPVTWSSIHPPTIGRTAMIVEQLKEIYFKKLPVVIITTDATYTNMAIESIGISKTLELGTSREIPISFKKVNVTKTETTTIPDSYGKSGATQASGGTASTTAASSGGSSGSGSDDSGNKSNSKSSILYNASKSLGLI